MLSRGMQLFEDKSKSSAEKCRMWLLTSPSPPPRVVRAFEVEVVLHFVFGNQAALVPPRGAEDGPIVARLHVGLPQGESNPIGTTLAILNPMPVCVRERKKTNQKSRNKKKSKSENFRGRGEWKFRRVGKRGDWTYILASSLTPYGHMSSWSSTRDLASRLGVSWEAERA